MPSVGFEPTISAGERPKTYVLDRAATGTGLQRTMHSINRRKGREILKFQEQKSKKTRNVHNAQNFWNFSSLIVPKI
jgi:hypothetical protein